MVIVTDKEYNMDKMLIKKIDAFCDLITRKKDDALMIIDGDEGSGKSNMGVACGYYAAHKLNRPFSVDNVFFDPDEMISFAANTDKQVIIWDEAAIVGLAAEWQNKVQKKIRKLMMVARKKNHFYFFNIPRFFRLNEFFSIERSVGLIHVYVRNGTEYGRFVYFNKHSKEILYREWKRKDIRNYREHFVFHGSFPEIMYDIIDEDEYERKKDEAILLIADDDEKMDKYKTECIVTRYKIAMMDWENMSERAIYFGISKTSLNEAKNNPRKYPKLFK